MDTMLLRRRVTAAAVLALSAWLLTGCRDDGRHSASYHPDGCRSRSSVGTSQLPPSHGQPGVQGGSGRGSVSRSKPASKPASRFGGFGGSKLGGSTVKARR